MLEEKKKKDKNFIFLLQVHHNPIYRIKENLININQLRN